MRYLKIVQFLLIVLVTINGCSKQNYGIESLKDSPLSSKNMYLFTQDIDDIFQGDMLAREGLIQSAKESIGYFGRIDPDRTFYYGKVPYSAAEMVESTRLFLELLQQHPDRDDFVEAMQENFLVFSSAANEVEQGVLFTGYYEPIFPGQLTRSKQYNVPVYRRPDDLQVLELGEFRDSLKRRTIVYRTDPQGRPIPYHTREQIMGEGILGGKGLEIAYMSDPVDLFFLQVQGSGILMTPEGERIKVGYDGSNGRPYSSIGRYLIDEGAMRLSEISMGSIRRYMADNPKLRDRVLYHNESYVFFRINPDSGGPRGNINVPLTPLRSVAVDSMAFPKGALAYIVTEVPEFDEEWRHQGNKPVSHFVMIQDTGGAIKGPARVDLFWGNGELAENSAGAMRGFGKLYFFVARKEILKARM
ncbi:MAG: MltA domain-containing protein [bacterium]|nr:MltA domain-containing protein [bacterium]